MKIERIKVPRYRVTAETLRPPCKEVCQDEDCPSQPMCVTDGLKACLDEGGWRMEEITKIFSSKKAAAKWAAWVEFNNRRFPNVERLTKGVADGYEADDILEAARAEVSAIALELFGVRL